MKLETILAALMAVMLAACVNDDGETNGNTNTVNVGDRTPAFTLAGTGVGEASKLCSPQDGTVSSSSLNGQVYLLTFFDTGCPDCQKELPVLQQVYDMYKDEVAVFNVPRSQSVDEVKQYWSKAGLSMPVFMPQDKDLYYQFANRGIPRTYVVDGEGVVQAVFTDAPIASYEAIESTLRPLLKGNTRGTVNLSLSLRVDKAASDDVMLHNEHTISRLDLFFFDAATKKLAFKKTINDLSNDEASHNTEYDVTYIIKSLRIKVGVYNIFAIANYDKVSDSIVDQDVFLNIIDDSSYKDGILASIPITGPVMTSKATSLLDVNLIPWTGKEYTISLDMERVMAKLQIGVAKNYFELNHDGKKYADINITNYKLVNLNKQFYLFQHKDDMTSLGQQPTFELLKNFTDYVDEGNQYVVDPLFYQKTLNENDALKFKDNYESWFGNPSEKPFASMPVANNYGYAYILENTAFKDCQKNGYSTGIVYMAAVSPVSVYLYDNSTFSLIEESRPEYWPNTIYLYKYNFYGSLQALNMASGLTLDELQTYTDVQLKSYGIKQCKFAMGVYHTFYTYWIRHRLINYDVMGPMRYGIARNNFYKLVVSGINGIGNSEIIPELMRDNYPNSYLDVVVD